MADVLIKFDTGYEPQFESFTVHPDGDVCVSGTDEVVGYAIKLPPHGILKDTDLMLECLEAIRKDYPEAYKLISGVIERTPTVLEATE